MKKFGFGLMRLPTQDEYTKIDLPHFQKMADAFIEPCESFSVNSGLLRQNDNGCGWMADFCHPALDCLIPENSRICQGRAARRSRLPLTNLAFSGHSGRRPSYMIDSSPYTLPQLRIGIVHFFVASNVERYNAFISAVSLGNTLRWLFSRR